MADAGEAIAAGDSGLEHWNSSLCDHPPCINDQEKERLLSEQFQNLLLTLVKGGKLEDEGEGLVPDDALRIPWDGHRDREDQVEGLGEALEILHDGLVYPRRPGVVDCGYYLRTGTCRFGASCKFNHPASRTITDGQEKDALDVSKKFIGKQGQVECKFYKTAGGCKYGNACRYKHTNLEVSHPSDVELNFLGLPLRPGTKECQYYMRSGTCKYAANCWFNHPDPSDVKESDFSAGLCNITSPAAQSCLQQDGWEDSGPFFPTGSPTKLEVPVEYSTSNSYQAAMPMLLYRNASGWIMSMGGEALLIVQIIKGPTAVSRVKVLVIYHAPHYTSERSIHKPLSYSTSDTLRDIGSWTGVASEYPERPGQPDCSYFLKTGNCKFKSNCRYNHPMDRLSILPQTTLNNEGLPLRPGQIPCSHYIRHSICKFGQACKFDHPSQLSSSFLVSNDGPAIAGITDSLWYKV